MEHQLQTRLWRVGGVLVLGAALAGMFTGTRAPTARSPQHFGEHGPNTETQVERAASYSELRGERRGPNATMYDQAFEWLRSLPGDARDPSKQTPEDRKAALMQRAERRAYAGAPPVIPHPVQNREASACLACHEGGAKIGSSVAPAMSHRKLSMCTQCHSVNAETAPTMVLDDVGGENLFVGIVESSAGARAYAGAPPTIPHPVMMRENCATCHGPKGQFGMRTPHPQQTNCEQCHAPASNFEPSGPPAMDPASLFMKDSSP